MLGTRRYYLLLGPPYITRMESPSVIVCQLRAFPLTRPTLLPTGLRRIFDLSSTFQKWKLIRGLPEISLLEPRPPSFDFLDVDEAERFISVARDRLRD